MFVVTAVIGWTSYCVVRARRQPADLTDWGLRPENPGGAWKPSLAPGIAAALAFVGWGAAHGTLRIPLHGLALLLLYPLWGDAC